MDLLDALCSNTQAKSVVELSLNPAFRRSYTALYKGIDEAELAKEAIARLVGTHFVKVQNRWTDRKQRQHQLPFSSVILTLSDTN